MISLLLPLVRTDFIILTGLMAAYEFFKGEKAFSIGVVLIAALEYFLINKIAGNYGWLTIFNFTLIAISPYPADMVLSKNLGDYLRPYMYTLVLMVAHVHFPVYMMTIFSCIGKKKVDLLARDSMSMVVIPISFVALHLILFPTYMHRFFVAPVALNMIWLLVRAKKSSKEESGDYASAWLRQEDAIKS